MLAAALGTVAEILSLYKTVYAVLDDTCIGPYMHVSHPYEGGEDILSFLITLFTDGLLVSILLPIYTRELIALRFGGAIRSLQE